MQWQIYTGTWRVYEYMYMDADEIHLRCSAHAPDGTWRCSRFVSIPVFVSDLQPARLLRYRRWTREIFPIKSQVGIKAANAQPTPGTQLETENQVRSRVKPVFHRLVVGGVSFLIGRSNTSQDQPQPTNTIQTRR